MILERLGKELLFFDGGMGTLQCVRFTAVILKPEVILS